MWFDALTAQALAHLPPAAADPALVEPVAGMMLLCHQAPTAWTATLYEPVVCLILQGQKETAAHERRAVLSAGDALVVSHDLPVVARITQAEPARPYLALIVTLDTALLRGLCDEVGATPHENTDLHAMIAHRADPRLVDALSRYLALAADPTEARVLLPLVRREVHFRLLMAPNGGTLRQLVRQGSHAHGVARAIGHLREHLRGPVSIPELAGRVGMSPSSLYKHFKAITSTTPLQYLKDLRLLEARRLLSGGGHTVSSAAYAVGYESPNQFSREFSRKFGVAPRALRIVAPEA